MIQNTKISEGILVAGHSKSFSVGHLGLEHSHVLEDEEPKDIHQNVSKFCLLLLPM